MISKLVLIIHNRLLNIDDIKQDLKEERYPHHFVFGENLKDLTTIDRFDEVWTFGDCRADKLYKLAVANNMDIWEMY